MNLNSFKVIIVSYLFCAIFLLSCSDNSPEKFLGKWENKGESVGEIYKGSTVEIKKENENLIVLFKGGGDKLQNTGLYKNGKIEVTLSWMGPTQITYSKENGEEQIYLFGAKMSKVSQ